MVIAMAAGAGLVVIGLGAVSSEILAGRTGGWVVWPLLLVALGGFTVSGLVAGRLRPDTPIAHGAMAAAVAFAAALALGLLLASLRNRSVSLAVIPLTALIAVTLGVSGSLLADTTRRRAAVRDRDPRLLP